MMHSQKRQFLLLLIGPFLLTGCLSSMIKNIIKDSPVPNWIGIHENPRVGDYAIHRQKNGNLVRYEIMSEEGELYEVSQRFIKTTLVTSTLKTFSVNVFVDKNGYVKKAFFVDLKSKKRDRLKVARTGDLGYIEDPKVVHNKNIITTEVVTEAGTFMVDRFRVFNFNIYKNGVKVRATQIQLIHPKAKFQVVSLRVTAETRMEAAKVLSMMVKFIPGDPVSKYLINFLLGKLEQNEYHNSAELIKMN